VADRRPKPLSDPETAPYWEAARRHELMMQRCSACAHIVFPPRPRCPACLAEALEWTKLSGMGTIRTFTIMHDTFMKGFDPPYVVADVDLPEQPGLKLTTNIVECDPRAVHIGQAVEVTFEDREGDVTVPQFRPRKTGND
jgi:uncharacterized OB-fold protein